MKKTLNVFMIALLGFSMAMFTGCGDDDDDNKDNDVPVEDADTDTIPADTANRGFLMIRVKESATSQNFLNNERILGVLAKSGRPFLTAEYTFNLGRQEAQGKIIVDGSKKNLSEAEGFVASKHMKEDEAGEGTGGILFKWVESGSYFYQVSDGENVVGGFVQIVPGDTTFLDEFISPAVNLSIIAAQGGTAGAELNNVEIRLYDGDTDIQGGAAALEGLDPLVTVTTSEQEDENGNPQKGIAFLYGLRLINYADNNTNGTYVCHAIPTSAFKHVPIRITLRPENPLNKERLEIVNK